MPGIKLDAWPRGRELNESALIARLCGAQRSWRASDARAPGAAGILLIFRQQPFLRLAGAEEEEWRRGGGQGRISSPRGPPGPGVRWKGSPPPPLGSGGLVYPSRLLTTPPNPRP